MFNIRVLNAISAAGLEQFPAESYHIATDSEQPEAILVRSHNMQDFKIPDSLLIVGRAGVGVNNIPVDVLTKHGIPVLNTPGANTNAVCELVMAGMLMASRHIYQAAEYTHRLTAVDDAQLEREIESNKKRFAGTELRGKTLGVIGLGSIGVQTANVAAALGMHILGHDPAISVEHAWRLSADVKHIKVLDELLSQSDFVTVHVPLLPETKKLINAKNLSILKKKAVLLNFSRHDVVDDTAILAALEHHQLSSYVCDFPTLALKNHPNILCLPHLGASTMEAEENCALMIVRAVREFLENGAIMHSVNFPSIAPTRYMAASRIALIHQNMPGMVAQISTQFAAQSINIVSLQNGSRGDVAYTLVDLDTKPDGSLLKTLKTIQGMIRVRQVR